MHENLIYFHQLLCYIIIMHETTIIFTDKYLYSTIKVISPLATVFCTYRLGFVFFDNLVHYSAMLWE